LKDEIKKIFKSEKNYQTKTNKKRTGFDI
jgi:hypothetical protein